MRDKILKILKMIEIRENFAKNCERVPFFLAKGVFFVFCGKKKAVFEQTHKNCKNHEKNNNKPNSKDTTKRVQILKLRDTILIILNLREMRENERKITGKFVAEKFSNSIIFINCVVDLCLFAELVCRRFSTFRKTFS